VRQVGSARSAESDAPCAGTGGVYRVERADDPNWLYDTFGDYLD